MLRTAQEEYVQPGSIWTRLKITSNREQHREKLQFHVPLTLIKLLTNFCNLTVHLECSKVLLGAVVEGVL